MGLSAGIFLIGLAAILSGVGWIWLTVVAFKCGEKIWGWLLVASLILPIGPFVAVAFMVMRWSVARRPAILLLASLAPGLLGAVLLLRAGTQMAQDVVESTTLEVNGTTTSSGAPSEPPATPSPEAAPRPAHRPPPPPPPARPAASPSNNAPQPASSVAGRTTPETDRDPARPPVELEVLELGESSPNQLRRLRVRARNEDPRPVQEIKIEVEYLDRRGVRLGRWTTVHGDTNSVLAGTSSSDFEFQAFFVPQFTKNVRLGVEGVVFADGTRWPSPE